MDIEYYKRIVANTLRDSEIRSITNISGGLDFDVFEVNSAMVFRFPKTKQNEEKLKKEINLIERLKRADLGLIIPEYIGTGFDEHCIFGYYPKIIGIPFSPDGPNLDTNLKKIIALLQSLSGIYPANDEINLHRLNWQNYFQALVDEILEIGLEALDKETAKYLSGFLSSESNELLKRKFLPSLIHSDLKSDHLICDDQNNIKGIIDWSDATFGDPLFDYSRLINEFGFEHSINKATIDIIPRNDFKKLFFYVILIPFLSIHRGIRNKNNLEVTTGVKRLNDHLKFGKSYLSEF